ncbi:unnamed protein product [Trichogramma brassicae]|uniref:V-type proton ATPase subunit a n=1 Tax=Trichogramma brassicae TaxID=86971 RepID=A0A6H5IFG4_9HYME|nr:unnamed protein product [Trichogramma brassicae]
MGAMFRSEKMGLAQLFIQPEAAYLSISEIGETGKVQFRDLNSEVSLFQRKYVHEVRRCDEMERKLRFISSEVAKHDVLIPETFGKMPRAPNPREIIDLEAKLEKTEHDVLELNSNAVNLKANYLKDIELRYILDKTHIFFSETDMDTMGRVFSEETQTQHSTQRGRLDFVAGVIDRNRMPAFERMLWRISRGNALLKQADIEKPLEDPITGNPLYKTTFVVFFQGEQLKSRIQKICSGFHASIHHCPSNYSERKEMNKHVQTRIADLELVLNQTQDHRYRVLQSVAKDLSTWEIQVKKMKAIYHTLNLFNIDVSKECLIGECWVPMADIGLVQECLAEGTRQCGNAIPSFLNILHTDENPPTYNRTNKFTQGFQVLIDAYGVASYREANPALYTIVTFPFLFSVMFGDAGHGLILFLFGLYMVTQEKKILKQKSKNEIWNIFFGGRYIILMMGLFSIYTGIIYNDIFSKSVNVFQSSWNVSSYDRNYLETHKSAIQLDPKSSFWGHPYPVGMDPAWALAENKIIFSNSYKMKLSIIFGVVHMIFGVSVSVVNIIHFKRYSSLIFEYLPQLLFLVLLFAYMVALMFMKWILYSAQNTGNFSEGCAPSILITFINMMLFRYDNTAETTDKNAFQCPEEIFVGQKTLQMTFVFVALACIPLMLFGKPIYFLCTKKSKKSKPIANGMGSGDVELQQSNGTANHASSHDDGHGEEDSFGEVMIHQAIHTIEYVLSTVSHTASYLRLWALSLAHAQLSDVLWNMVLKFGFGAEEGQYLKAIYLFLSFGAWALFTLAILVMMEGLSAFLHTLRLHWVEFMSKFYKGEGYIFQPFSFKNILDSEESTEDD